MRAHLAFALSLVSALLLGCAPPASPCAGDRDCATGVCVEGRCLDAVVGSTADATSADIAARFRDRVVGDGALAAREAAWWQGSPVDGLPPEEAPPMPPPRNASVDAEDLPDSCLDILLDDDEAPSGSYLVRHLGTGEAVVVACDMETDGGGWTLLADVGRFGCPAGWDFVEGTGCGRPNANVQQIASAFFDVTVDFTEVAGAARAIATGGANKGFNTTFAIVDSSTPYVDGLSLTANVGAERTHLYTFAAGAIDTSTISACPADGGQAPPEVVGVHFSCDSSASSPELWSGDDLGDDRPRFVRDAPLVSADRIEARIISPFFGLQSPVYVTSLSIAVR